VPCITGKDIVVMYVITTTTTTTNTTMTAPFVAANGPLNYVGGGFNPIGPATTNNSVAGRGAAAWTRCLVAPSRPGATSVRLTCPVTAVGTPTAKRTTGRALVKQLTCSSSLGARTAHIAHGHTASPAAHTRTMERKPARARGRIAVGHFLLCRNI
jgi:hypothetical protein